MITMKTSLFSLCWLNACDSSDKEKLLITAETLNSHFLNHFRKTQLSWPTLTVLLRIFLLLPRTRTFSDFSHIATDSKWKYFLLFTFQAKKVQKCICKCADDAQCGAREFFLYFCARFFNLFLVCRLTLFSRLFSIVCRIVFVLSCFALLFCLSANVFLRLCVMWKIGITFLLNLDSILRVKRLAKCSAVVSEAVALLLLLIVCYDLKIAVLIACSATRNIKIIIKLTESSILEAIRKLDNFMAILTTPLWT